MIKHDDWLKAAVECGSFRRMYALAEEISNESDDPGMRRAAARVVQILAPVIDLPLASAKQLQEGRRRFAVLVNVLGDVTEKVNEIAPSTVVAQDKLRTRVKRVEYGQGSRAGSRQGRRRTGT